MDFWCDIGSNATIIAFFGIFTMILMTYIFSGDIGVAITASIHVGVLSIRCLQGIIFSIFIGKN